MGSQLSTLNAMLIETHAHLDYPDFAPDFDDVLRRATEAGVTRIITIGTSVESSRRAVDLAEKYPNVFAVIGVHPTYALEAEEDVITPLREQANEVLGLGHLVSFTGIVTFKNGKQVREVAAQVPLDQFMVETDCPYLAPVPFRGKRCEPAYTRFVAEEIARARGISLEEIAGATTATAEEFFRFNRGQNSDG